MLANGSGHLILNPLVIYITLGVYGLLIGAVVFYVYRKFNGASLLLRSLSKDWASAENSHKGLLDEAREHVSKLATAPAPSLAVSLSGPRSVTFDIRNQVIAMGRKGVVAADIARACAMPEADVDVLLGMARIQR